MESSQPPFDVVRCVDCHAVYEQAIEPRANAPSQACPECGGTAWLAAEIPLPETTAVEPA